MSRVLEAPFLLDCCKIPDGLLPEKEAFRFRLPDLFDPQIDSAILSQYAKFNKLVIQLFPETADQKIIFEAADLMATLHVGQAKRETDSYVSHPLDVAIRLLTQFEIRDRDLIVAGLLHDVGEDQALKLLRATEARVWHVDLASKDAQNSIKQAALWYLSAEFGERVAGIISQLTNPNFSRLADALSSDLLSEEKHYSEMLVELAFPYAHELRQACRQIRSDNMNSQARETVKRGLYVGHLIELLDHQDAFKVKMADFSSNALGALNSDGEYRLRLELQNRSSFRDRLMRKYAPLTNFLAQYFSQEAAHNRKIFSASVDLAFIQELKLARARYSSPGGLVLA